MESASTEHLLFAVHLENRQRSTFSIGRERMPTPQLRVFSEDAAVNNHPVVASSMVAVSLGDVVPLLLHASRTNRNWIEDFADESLEVSQDLYEILLAYKPIAEQARCLA